MSGFKAGQGTLLTFDCYGTLIDWEEGILAGLREAYPEADDAEDAVLMHDFHSAQNRLKTSEYRPYRQLLAETAELVAQSNGWRAPPGRSCMVPDSVPAWQPFPDTNAALSKLDGAGVTLGILSNIDNDLLAGTLERFGVAFGRIATAQDLKSYKPAASHFERGRAWARTHDAWVHVAQSLFHDVVPAAKLGIPVLWVNRKAEALPEDVAPVHISADLAGAVKWLLPSG